MPHQSSPIRTLGLFVFLAAFAGCGDSNKKNSAGPENNTETSAEAAKLELVAEFKDAQVTGVTVSGSGRTFASFPRWRNDLPFSVVEVFSDGTHKPYPNAEWNRWTGSPRERSFTCVQSVVADGDSLFLLDPSNPLMKGVVGRAKLYEFDLPTDSLKRTWEFGPDVAPSKSYLNDLRVDEKAGKIYITDSGLGALIVLDMASGASRRILDRHPSTKAEDTKLVVEGRPFTQPVHADGIALAEEGRYLYFHALTGRTLYRIPLSALRSESLNESRLSSAVESAGTTPAPDGMIFGPDGILYMADLEKNSIVMRGEDGTIRTLIQDSRIKWADTFTIDPNGFLVFSVSRLHEFPVGAPTRGQTFGIYRFPLPGTLEL